MKNREEEFIWILDKVEELLKEIEINKDAKYNDIVDNLEYYIKHFKNNTLGLKLQ